ncbi:hypothetical protein MMC07_008886 [Pseudocyphellaria aurata]|nr:hypothetical protein [Pseudocyphellaria aurata]
MYKKPVVSAGSVGGSTNSVKESNPQIEPVDRAAEKRLIRKCDLHVLAPVALLYLLAFLDRINIGNARIQGLEADLNMKGQDFNVALSVFFILYVTCEVPSNLLLRKIAPSTWLSLIMFCWGIITVCTGFTQSFAGLVVCRISLGLCEAGFFPGCLYLISMYYRRYELQQRITLFFSTTIIAGAFSGLLAYGIANMSGVGGYKSWRWMFIIEGVLTIIAAACGKYFIVDWPETAKFLNAEERSLLLRRLQEDVAEAKMDRWDTKSKARIFGDWKIYTGTIIYFGVINTGYSISFFTPTILKQLGWTAVRAQVLTIPVYAFSFVVTIVVAICTDRLRHRYAFAMLGILLATIGYGILLAQEYVHVSARYMALFLVAAGSNITAPVVLVWLNNNMAGHYKRSISAAMQIGFGNCGGIIASNIYITAQAPTYLVGYGVSLALMWIAGLACTVFFIGLRTENLKRDRGERDDRYNLPKEELDNLGDDHPSFRFTF